LSKTLDAGATRIEIATAGGGLSLIGLRIMVPALVGSAAGNRPPCTSKLSNDIHDIRSLGFRGEALPSIGSIGRLTIRSRAADADRRRDRCRSGKVGVVRPAPCNRGTLVEVRDLFFATPARLKFMKGDRAEASAVSDVKRVAIAFPTVRFTVRAGSPDARFADRAKLTPDGWRASRR
jgi:DNA mismatch repair protein MutL